LYPGFYRLPPLVKPVAFTFISIQLLHMGFMLPNPDSPAERAKALMVRRSALEAELDDQLSILRANGVDGRSPLVDAEGFPRADIDIWAVRHARVRAIEIRNDLSVLTDEMAKALSGVYDPAFRPADEAEETDERTNVFAKVDGVSTGSPAATAVRFCLGPTSSVTEGVAGPGHASWRSRAPVFPSHEIVFPLLVLAATS
jgi:hypothetical protein